MAGPGFQTLSDSGDGEDVRQDLASDGGQVAVLLFQLLQGVKLSWRGSKRESEETSKPHSWKYSHLNMSFCWFQNTRSRMNIPVLIKIII